MDLMKETREPSCFLGASKRGLLETRPRLNFGLLIIYNTNQERSERDWIFLAEHNEKTSYCGGFSPGFEDKLAMIWGG